ncbi:MAG: IPT/TIG domain-containing protein [Acidobacteriota bacterium]
MLGLCLTLGLASFACDSTHPTFTEVDLFGEPPCGPSPVLTSSSPDGGPPDTVLTLTGRGFLDPDGNHPVVSFDDLPARIIEARDDQLLVLAPSGVPAGVYVSLSVRHCGGEDLRQDAFRYLPGLGCGEWPKLESVEPDEGVVGAVVTLRGVNLTGHDDLAAVWFGDVAAEVLTTSMTELTVRVPAGNPVGAPVRVLLETCGGKDWIEEAFTIAS